MVRSRLVVDRERHDDDVDDDRGMVEIPGGKKENSNRNACDSFSLSGWMGGHTCYSCRLNFATRGGNLAIAALVLVKWD